ncbi:hypothetical protein [[Mycoplasma] collis]|uniref:hypothetical protein n=1 Tax=[Mycoplasma] collis TaxID=2127 RepID=UPI00051B3A99|nr:hypothetical protein [[Mycoplasma] collis]
MFKQYKKEEIKNIWFADAKFKKIEFIFKIIWLLFLSINFSSLIIVISLGVRNLIIYDNTENLIYNPYFITIISMLFLNIFIFLAIFIDWNKIFFKNKIREIHFKINKDSKFWNLLFTQSKKFYFIKKIELLEYNELKEEEKKIINNHPLINLISNSFSRNIRDINNNILPICSFIKITNSEEKTYFLFLNLIKHMGKKNAIYDSTKININLNFIIQKFNSSKKWMYENKIFFSVDSYFKDKHRNLDLLTNKNNLKNDLNLTKSFKSEFLNNAFFIQFKNNIFINKDTFIIKSLYNKKSIESELNKHIKQFLVEIEKINDKLFL